ncbi:hypothetical protein J6590_102761 [Homalodisca vitripennis]|nr:hypothetical protein J6590_102761 [Homalodisca vitripennis]
MSANLVFGEYYTNTSYTHTTSSMSKQLHVPATLLPHVRSLRKSRNRGIAEIKTTGDVPWGSLVERGRRGPRSGQRGVQDHQKSCVGLVDGERWTTREMIHSERENKYAACGENKEPRLLILKGLEKGLRVGDVISGQ